VAGTGAEALVDESFALDTALVADLDGFLHAAYVAEGEGSAAAIRYATDASGNWVSEEVAPGQLPGAIAVDASGRPHIVFLQASIEDPFRGELRARFRNQDPVAAVPSITSRSAHQRERDLRLPD
jgi:hypothetical protein